MMEINDAKIRAARLCSQQERCSHDIREKLKQWDVPEKNMEVILGYLKQEKFLDDSRYASFFVKDKFRFNQWGKIKIRYMLRQKQMPEEIIEEALEQISGEDYLETLLQLLRGKLKSISDTNHLARKAKLMRFASQRGFETDIIYKALRQIKDDNYEEI